MVYQIISSGLLEEFIRGNREYKLVIEFKAEWCEGSFVLKSAFQKFSVRYSNGNLKFASVDIDTAGLEDLNSTRVDLRLGAIPTFCIFENNFLSDRLVTCSPVRLDIFLKSHYIGYILENENEKNFSEANRKEDEPEQLIKRSSRSRSRYKKRILKNSPTKKTNDLQMNQKELNDPKIIQMENRIMEALNFNNIDKSLTIDFFRSPSPNKYTNRGFSPDKYTNRGLSPDKYTNRGFSPDKFPSLGISHNRNPNRSSNDKYPDRGFSIDKLSSHGQLK